LPPWHSGFNQLSLDPSTTILDAVELFTAEDRIFFYVIDINKIVGVLCYEDLFKPIGRIAFLSLALEIEDLALRLCQSPKFREGCWLSISNNRKQMSLGFFEKRYHRKPRIGEETDSADANIPPRPLLVASPITPVPVIVEPCTPVLLWETPITPTTDPIPLTPKLP
jgi:hypothetical protein